MSNNPNTVADPDGVDHPAAVEAALQHQQQVDEADAARRQQLDDQAAALTQDDEQPGPAAPATLADAALDYEIEL